MAWDSFSGSRVCGVAVVYEGEDMKDKWKKAKSEIDAIMETTKPTRKEMQRNAALYAGQLWNDTEPDTWEFSRPGTSKVQFNLIFATVESVAPLVTDNRPVTRVAPTYPFMEKMGIALNNATKYMWNTLDLQRKTYLWVKDAMIKKHGIWEVGYDDNTDNPTVDGVDPVHFFRAPGYIDLWDCPFCGWRKMVPVSWVHKHFPDVKEIKNSVSITQGGEDPISEKPERIFKFGEITPVEMGSKFVRVYKLWTRDDETYEEITKDADDKKKKVTKQKYPYGKLCWFTSDQYLGDQACTDEHGKPPFVELPNYDKPHDTSGISDVDNIRGIHEETNILLKYWIEYVRRYHAPNRQFDSDSDFDIEGFKETSTEGNQIYAYSGSSMFGKDKPPLTSIEEPMLNPQIPNFFQFLMMLADTISGVTDPMKGNVGKQERQSASEIAILLESSHTRIRQKVRNLEWALKRAYYLIIRNIQQYWNKPKQMSWQETDGVGYASYGNSKAQAEDIMKPSEPLPSVSKGENWLERKIASGLPLEEDEQAAWDRYQQEYKDYRSFIEYFAEDGELDPVYIDFDIQVQTDSMLPMDKQGRANVYLRLHAQKAIDNQALLEELDIAGAQEIVARMNQQEQQANMPKQSPQDMAAMQANPQAAQQYAQQVQGGQQ